MEGAVGPSDLIQHIAFQEISDTLCDYLSSVARRLAPCLVDLASLSAFTAYCLIALDRH